MTDTNIDAIYNRIRKLQALALDPGASEHEAALAAQRVQTLLDKHNLDMSAIGSVMQPDQDVMNSAVRIETGKPRYQQPTWEFDLAIVVAKAYYCGVIRHTNAGWYSYEFYGTKLDLEVCTSIFAQLRNKLLALSTKRVVEYSNKMIGLGYDVRLLRGSQSLRSYRNSWYNGAVYGVRDILDSTRRQNNNEIRALVVTKDAANNAAIEKAHPKLQSIRSAAVNHNRDALAQGFSDGKAMRINKELPE